MTRVCGIDIETTGLDHVADHCTEIAWVIKDVGDPKPLVAKTSFVLPPEDLWNSPDYIKPFIAQLTKIQMRHLMAGRGFFDVISELEADLQKHNVDFIVAHNGENFDKPFLQNKAKQAVAAEMPTIFGRQWLDTSVDCVYPEECRYTNLMYLAAFFGFLNPFPHSALFDVMTMLKVLDNFDVLQVAERAKIPWIVVQAMTSYEQRDLAKSRRYYWENIGNEKYPRQWVKKIKESDFDKEVAEAPFQVVKIA